MCESNITNKKTPLRNSNSANKPFRSPLTTILTPKNNESPKNIPHNSPLQNENQSIAFDRKSETPKRTILQSRHPLKRRKIDNTCSVVTASESDDNSITRSDLLAIRKRVRTKKQELDNLRRKLHYVRKHKSEDLRDQISKWRDACKEALLQLHEIVRSNEGESSPMKQVLATLRIPEDVVRFVEDECDLS